MRSCSCNSPLSYLQAFNLAFDTVANTQFSPFSSNFVTQKDSSFVTQKDSSSTANAFWLSEADFAQLAELSSPFSSSEAVCANIFEHVKIESKGSAPRGTFCGNLDRGLCELSAGSASSMERASVPCRSYKQQHAEVQLLSSLAAVLTTIQDVCFEQSYVAPGQEEKGWETDCIQRGPQCIRLDREGTTSYQTTHCKQRISPQS